MISKKELNKQRINITGGVIKEVTFGNITPNLTQIRNYTDYILYLSENIDVSTTKYMKLIPAHTTIKYANIDSYQKLYFYCSNNVSDIYIVSTRDDELSFADMDEDSVINATVAVSLTELPAGTNNIGEVSILDGEIETIGTKADNKNGATDTTAITAMSILKYISYMLQNPASIATGTNTIGKVKINDGVEDLLIDTNGNANTVINKFSDGATDLVLASDGSILTKQNDLASVPTIYNITCTLSDTEYSQSLPVGCRNFTIGLKSKNSLVAWVLKFTTSGTEFTFNGEENYNKEDIILSSQTLFFECNNAGETIQIIAWS